MFITRSFSKAHGIAGLRLGYVIGRSDTVQPIARSWGLGSLNTLTASTGVASQKDTRRIDDERAENARVRPARLRSADPLPLVLPLSGPGAFA